MRIESITATPLSVPLLEPFVIASGRMDATRAALVRVQLRDSASGRSSLGIGEAAPLPPVTSEDQPDVLAAIAGAAGQLAGRELDTLDALAGALDALLSERPVARAGLECALLDAWARLLSEPVCGLLRQRTPRRLLTDITLPISEPEHMAELAAGHRARGFRVFKVKVGKRFDDDVSALRAVRARVPDARFRLDANAGFSAEQALELMRVARAARCAVECFEQPCAREDLDGMARVTREAGVPVIADESVRTQDDLTRVVQARAAHAINLKLSKSGGLLAALSLGDRARAHGLQLMCGGMVETRLGITAMAHVACALPEVEYIDLDTAFLLAEERFEGGYRAEGPTLDVASGLGLGVSEGD